MEEIKKKKRVSNEVKYRYKKKAYKRYAFELHHVNDADCIEYLNKQPNKIGKLKELIRKDIKEN